MRLHNNGTVWVESPPGHDLITYWEAEEGFAEDLEWHGLQYEEGIRLFRELKRALRESFLKNPGRVIERVRRATPGRSEGTLVDSLQ